MLIHCKFYNIHVYILLWRMMLFVQHPHCTVRLAPFFYWHEPSMWGYCESTCVLYCAHGSVLTVNFIKFIKYILHEEIVTWQEEFCLNGFRFDNVAELSPLTRTKFVQPPNSLWCDKFIFLTFAFVSWYQHLLYKYYSFKYWLNRHEFLFIYFHY